MKVMLTGSLLGKGGIPSHLRWLSRGLVEEGIQTSIVSLGDAIPSNETIKIVSDLQDQGVCVEFLPPYRTAGFAANYAKLARASQIARLIKKHTPDVYVAVGTGWNLFIAPLISRVKMRRIFFEVMSGIPVSRIDSRWGVKWWFDEVIGQARPVAANFANYFDWNGPIAVIPAMPEPLELTARLPLPKTKNVKLGQAKAAFFSRLVPHKQAFWLVRQWNELKTVLGELHIHGSGPEEALIRDYIDENNLGDRVKCFGRYPEGPAYVDLLSSYDVTLLPTIGAEGAPLVLLESMACGVPFVAYGAGGISDYVVNNPDSIVIPPEGGQFVDAVKRMVVRLADGDINTMKLQQHYLENYSYHALKRAWVSHLSES